VILGAVVGVSAEVVVAAVEVGVGLSFE